MPTTYAHYRFGRQVLSALPEEIRSVAEKHLDLFDTGVHGPDLLFYHGPLKRNPVSQRGYDSHGRTGRDFFTEAAEALKSSPDRERTFAYLIGVLCHFSLDRDSHPYVAEKEQDGVSHSLIEASFDAFLMKKDGIDPLKFRPVGHLKPSKASAAAIAPVYAPIPADIIFKTQKAQILQLTILATPPGVVRKVLTLALEALKKNSILDMLIPAGDVPQCRDSDEKLFACYENALRTAAEIIPEFVGYVNKNTPLGGLYDHTFGVE